MCSDETGDSDPTGRTLTVWFGQPQNEYVAEETGDEIILMKDRDGRVIGFERLNYAVQPERIAFQTLAKTEQNQHRGGCEVSGSLPVVLRF